MTASPSSPPPAPAGGGTSPRDPVLILILNLLLLGCVGYFLIGQRYKAIIALVASLVLIGTTCGVGTGLICIFAAIDGYQQAQLLDAGRAVGQWTFFRDSSWV